MLQELQEIVYYYCYRMADETVVRGKHHKLKRIVQKKAKVGLNTSGSVSYYKKVKAALNASCKYDFVTDVLSTVILYTRNI